MKKKAVPASPAGSLTLANVPSILRSIAISTTAVLAVVLLKKAFPDVSFSDLQAAVLTGVSGVIVAMVKEIIVEK